MENHYATLKNMYDALGIPFKESETLKNMLSPEEILNMTQEQAEAILDESGYGWGSKKDFYEGKINTDGLDFNVSNDSIITIDFSLNKKPV